MLKDSGAVDAALILLNLDDYRVLSAGVCPAGRTVVVDPISTEQLPLRSRLTTRLVGSIVEAASTEVRAAAGIAAAHGVA